GPTATTVAPSPTTGPSTAKASRARAAQLSTVLQQLGAAGTELNGASTDVAGANVDQAKTQEGSLP
ncbi:MAG TPA: hypothetical protein VFR41_11360, partial [Acidimicrobiia bacterium]|nr:hypothetical protein [Acidimicrobiia bacterium]